MCLLNQGKSNLSVLEQPALVNEAILEFLSEGVA